jgi:thymidylate synthase ThyX
MITIIDEQDVPNPEDRAMLQALYSRSPAPVAEHLKRVKKVGSGRFMGQYYLGYGHKSIGDCGYTTIFIEGISMLAAKAIQDNPLGNYQECSTRYLDFSNQPFYARTAEVQLLTDAWRPIYLKALPLVKNHVANVYSAEEVIPPGTPKEKQDAVYSKTLDAITFDIVRGLLPCGATTSVAWTTSLRKLQEHCEYLSFHPLAEVRYIATGILEEASKRYPNSVHPVTDRTREAYDRANAGLDNYYDTLSHPEWIAYPMTAQYVGSPPAINARLASLKREKGDPWPRALQNEAWVMVQGLIDFGSYRDLQRHRNGPVSMPLVNAKHGLHPWYMDYYASVGLADEVQERYRAAAEDTTYSSEVERQYAFPMATQVSVRMNWNLGQYVYVQELRSGRTVHPTLREFLSLMRARLAGQVPNLDRLLFIDTEPNYYQSRRGTQDITPKDQV